MYQDDWFLLIEFSEAKGYCGIYRLYNTKTVNLYSFYAIMFAVLNADLKICPCKICQGHISYNLDMNLF